MNYQVMSLMNDLAAHLEDYVEVGKSRAFRDALRDWMGENIRIYSQESIITQRRSVEDPKFIEHLKKKMATEMALEIWNKCGVDKATMLPNPEFRAVDSDLYGPEAVRIQVQILAVTNKLKG